MPRTTDDHPDHSDHPDHPPHLGGDPAVPDAVDRLLAELDPLPHPLRLRHLARTAHALAAAGGLPATLAELDRRGRYGRRLAALAAADGRCTPYLAGRLADPDDVVRRYARRALRRPEFPSAAIEAAYRDAPALVRTELASALLAVGRAATADRLVEQAREWWGERDAARLLPACSPGTAARLLPGLAHAVHHWGRLGRYQPQAVLALAERELAHLPAILRTMWWEQRAHGVAAACAADPHRVLALLERYGPGQLAGPFRWQLATLAAADAERTVRLLTGPHPGTDLLPLHLEPAALRRLAAADPPSLPALGRRWLDHPDRLAALLGALPPHRRAACYDAVTADAGPDGPHRTAQVLATLPSERRHTEARRRAARARAESWSAAERLATLALLPAGEAGPALLAATRAPEPVTRAAAWRGLAANAGYTRDDDARRTLLAEMAARLPKERDRIRTEALEALVRLARRTAPFTAADTDPLDRIARDVLAAPDSSDASRTALRDLAVTVITAGTLIAADSPAGDRSPLGWAARTLAELAAGPGPVGLGHLDRTLRRGREQLVLTALRPRLGTDPGRRLLFALTDALGRRSHRLPELQDLLAAAVRDGDDETFRAAARRWLAAPATRSGRVAELLAREPSAIVLPEVLAEVTARRTDLLDPLLGDAPPVRRFLPDPARRPHLGPRHADRLPPRRQQAAVRLARTVAEDVSRTQRERADALRTAAACPDHGRALLLEFAGSSDLMRPGTALAGIALAGLAATGDPAAALAGLAAHTDDDARARAAGHAADRIAARTPAGQLAFTLDELTAAIGKEEVAARKQAVRLYARYLPPDRAAAALADAYRVPGQHPDVLSLIVRRAVGLLGTEPVRDLLAEAAATGTPRVRLALLTDDPLGLPEAHRPYYARLVAGLAGGRPGEEGESVRHAAVWAMRHWAGYAPETADVVRHAVTDLSSRSGWQSAALVLGGLADSGQPHPLGGAAPGSLLHRTLAELAAATLAPGGPEETGRDLPALRRLDHLVEQGIRRPEILTAAAEHLAHDPELLPARVTLLRRAVDPHAALPDLTRALGALAAAHAGRPALAAESARQLAAHLGHHAPWPDPDAVLAAAERLTADGGLAAGLLATAVIEACATVSGLSPHWRAALHTLRRHPVPDVRFAARKVYAAAD